MSEEKTNQSTGDNTVAIVSYISLLGWIIAIVLHGNKKTELGAFHLRQTLGIFVIGIGLAVANGIFMFIPYLDYFLGSFLPLQQLPYWCYGFWDLLAL